MFRYVFIATLLTSFALPSASAVEPMPAGPVVEQCDEPVVVVGAGFYTSACDGAEPCSGQALVLVALVGVGTSACEGSGSACSRNIAQVIVVVGPESHACRGDDACNSNVVAVHVIADKASACAAGSGDLIAFVADGGVRQ